MIVTPKHLSRRTLLRGLGATIALPMLEAMTPALASVTGRQQKRPIRLAFVYAPNGVTMRDWKPAAAGRDVAFTRILKPLEPFREDVLILSGLDQQQANPLGDGGGGHARAGASYLTGVHCKKTMGSDIRGGVSVDQIVAQEIGSQTRLPSLELGCEDTRMIGNCDTGYSCAYTSSISWRTPTMPMPPETNPRTVFERMFGTEDPNMDPRLRARRLLYRRSILDSVGDHARQIVGTLSAADQRKVDEYLSGIREIERRIQTAENNQNQPRPDFERPAGITESFVDHLRLMFDLQILAFQADLTRVSTLMIGREGSLRTYPEIGIPDAHHPLTHHRQNREFIEKVTQINTYHVRLFSTYYVAKMKSIAEADGTLLQNCMVCYGSGLSEGNSHSPLDLPVLIVGQGGGALRTGRHNIYPPGTPMTNLLLTLVDRMGVHPEKVGDSTGRLGQLAGL
jgi:Protein of unknown function (DUF1552)